MYYVLVYEFLKVMVICTVTSADVYGDRVMIVARLFVVFFLQPCITILVDQIPVVSHYSHSMPFKSSHFDGGYDVIMVNFGGGYDVIMVRI